MAGLTLGAGLGIASSRIRSAQAGGDAVADPPARDVIHIFLVTGQSNERGSNGGAAHRAPLDARVLQWPSAGDRSGSLIPATERLLHPGTAADEAGTGPAMPMVEAMLPTLGTSDRVVLVPLAQGGTGYVRAGDAPWAVGGPLYENAVARMSALRATLAADYPDHDVRWTFTGFAGEDDVSIAADADVYLDAVTASFEGMASEAGIGAYAVVAPLMSPSWVGETIHGNAIQAAKLRLRERLPRVAILESPDGPYDAVGNDIHFAEAAQIVRGRATAAALDLARGRAAPLDPGIDALAVLPWGAWSLYRRLVLGYGGPALRLRRDGDGAEIDVGFDADGLVDRATIVAHCAGADGFVVTWYDQSGAGRHFTEIDPGQNAYRPPRLVVDGQIQWRGARPMMGGNNGALVHLAGAPPAESTAMVLGRFVTGGTRHVLSSRSLILGQTGGHYYAASHAAGTQNAGFALEDGVHVVVAGPDAGTVREVDGVTPDSVEITGQNGSRSATLALLARYARPGSIRSQSNDFVGEVVVGEGRWEEEAGRSIFAAATLLRARADRLSSESGSATPG